MTEPQVLCYQCGKHITEGKVFIRGEFNFGTPTFCARRCADAHNPDTLTLNSLAALIASIPKPETPEEKARTRHEFDEYFRCH